MAKDFDKTLADLPPWWRQAYQHGVAHSSWTAVKPGSPEYQARGRRISHKWGGRRSFSEMRGFKR